MVEAYLVLKKEGTYIETVLTENLNVALLGSFTVMILLATASWYCAYNKA